MRHPSWLKMTTFLVAFLCTHSVVHGQEAPASAASSSAAGNQAENTDDTALSRHIDDQAALAFSQAAIGRPLNDYSLLDREGKPVKFTDYRGKPLLISMIYSSCFHTCPVITQYLARAVKLARSAVGEDGFNVVSIGFDARYDRPDSMKTFARQRGVSDDPYWKFLSATDATVIQQLSDNLGFIFTKTHTGFDHLAQITVIDGEGKIYRQIYGENFNPPVLVETLKEIVFGNSVSSEISFASFVNKARLWCTIYDPNSNTYRFDYSMVAGLGVTFIILAIFIYIIVRMWIRVLSRSSA
ncbi:MAG TPA: SCO family protein [Gammaproteobacteria bacterium]|nr:SCO family protein [Gammaproteobacteria bacterium]